MKFLIIFVLASSFVFAIGISPNDFNAEVNKGDIIEKEFYVFNTKDKSVSYTSFVDLDWFSIYPDNFEIGGNNKQKVKVILEVPNNVNKGEYNGLIYFKEENNKKGVSLDSSIGIKFKVVVLDGDVKEEKEIINSRIVTGDITKHVMVRNKEKGVNYSLIVFFGLLLIVLILLVFVVWRKYE